MPNRTVRAGLGAAVVILAACGDSTTPHGVPPAQLARHIDSLMVQAESLHTNNGDARAEVLSRLEVAPALGASPVDVPVITSSGAKEWKGFMWKTSKNREAFPDDSGIALIVYSDNAATSVVFAEVGFSPDGTYYQQTLLGALADDTIPASAIVQGVNSGVVVGTVSSRGSCTLASGLSYPFAQDVSDCSLATFQGSISISFPVSSGPLSDFKTFKIAPQQFNGVWVK